MTGEAFCCDTDGCENWFPTQDHRDLHILLTHPEHEYAEALRQTRRAEELQTMALNGLAK